MGLIPSGGFLALCNGYRFFLKLLTTLVGL